MAAEMAHPAPAAVAANEAAAGGERPLRVYIVTGEHSGDALGARLMTALRAASPRPVLFAGLGGHAMEAEGLRSLFPLDEVVVMGPVAILKAYPRLRRRALEVVAACVAADPDILVIVDAPEFTHPIAKRVRKARPDIPIVDYVSPTVWAWRPGRARKMRPYVDHLMALLPFEPAAHERLGGPPCTYVGHPLVERKAWIDSLDTAPLVERFALEPEVPVLVVLPGSRTSEIERLLGPFGETVARLTQGERKLNVLIPAVPRHAERIALATAGWAAPTWLINGEEDKFRAFKLARAALAASGTVTLELAVAGTPMVVAYKVEPLAVPLRFLVKVPSIVLANLVLGQSVFPEFIQQDCTAEKLAAAVEPLLVDSPARLVQLQGLAAIEERLSLPAGTPSGAAAHVVLAQLGAE